MGVIYFYLLIIAEKRYTFEYMNGRFIVLEGPDGSGTTSHSKLLAEHLKAKGLPVLHTFEATDGPVGTFIREQLRAKELPGSAMQLLFCADRAWHEQHILIPALEQGTTVICDRYSLSTEVYGEAFGMDRKWLHDMNKAFIQPDMLLLALPPLSVCLARLEKRNKDSFEANEPLQRRVYELYAQHALTLPDGSVFDTSAEKESVFPKIARYVEQTLGL
jgi:dTMP kinase